MSEARELVLDAVRGALAGAAPAEAVPREYLRHGTLDAQARIALLCERISDYRAQVHRVDAADLAATIGDAFARQSATRVCVPAGVPAQWRPAGLDLLTDDGLSFDALDRLDGVLTGATLAIAQTGTIVLTAAPAEGRRALTLVPDLHVCVVGEEQVVETVPEALASSCAPSIASAEPAVESTPLPPVAIPASARISEALPRTIAGRCFSSATTRSVRYRSAPAATGSSTHGVPALRALRAATLIPS